VEHLTEIDYRTLDGDLYDELPLWSAPFGLMILDRVPLKAGHTYLDVGAGTGFLTVELAQRSGPDARVIAVDPWSAAVKRLRRKMGPRAHHPDGAHRGGQAAGGVTEGTGGGTDAGRVARAMRRLLTTWVVHDFGTCAGSRASW